MIAAAMPAPIGAAAMAPAVVTTAMIAAAVVAGATVATATTAATTTTTAAPAFASGEGGVGQAEPGGDQHRRRAEDGKRQQARGEGLEQGVVALSPHEPAMLVVIFISQTRNPTWGSAALRG